MQSHGTGPLKGSRIGAIGFNHSFPMRYTEATGVSKKLCTIDGSVQNPVAYRTRAIITTPNNAGTTATLSVGTTAGGTDILNAVDIKAAAGVNYAPAAAGEIKIATGSVDLYATPTIVGTAATAGEAYVLVEMWDVNTQASDTIGG